MPRSDGSNSPLSTLSSDFPEDASSVVWSEDNDPSMPPAKRRRISPDIEEPIGDDPRPDQDIASDISSDTEGSLPVSPSQRNFLTDEEALGREYLQVCKWDGCQAGDLGNQDELVNHIHDQHIGTKKSVYKCGWSDCTRKGQAHASAYALRAHMRSHTKEKPFYCALPECDRCFTRSDALAKHMRTVHETEALKPSDHVPLHRRQPVVPPSPPKNPIRLKLNFNKNSPSTPASNDATSDPETESQWNGLPLSPGTRRELFTPPPPDVQFQPHELEIPPQALYGLLRKQLQWAQQESAAHEKDEAEATQQYRKEWLAKELVLENVLEGEYHLADRKGVIAEETTARLGEGGEYDDTSVMGMLGLKEDAMAATRLPMKGPSMPWYRDPSVAKPEPAIAGDGGTNDTERGDNELTGHGRRDIDMVQVGDDTGE